MKSILGRCMSFLISSSLKLSAETVFRVRSMLATAFTWSRPLLLRFDGITSCVREILLPVFEYNDGLQLQRLLWRKACIALLLLMQV